MLVTAAIAATQAVDVLPAQADELVSAFIDNYRTNISANRTVQSNAAVRALAGMQRLWRTGTTWNDGRALDSAVLAANIRHVVAITG
ncbi:MAG TPA: phosphoesterase, partial [Kutzneria sp.]|nr:phosphoesterase [Kutzneria sp.]